MADAQRTNKSSWLQKQLKQREKEYTSTFEFPLLCTTWNVNMAKVEVWPMFLECRVVPGMLFLGFQEVDMSAESLLKLETLRAQQYADSVTSQLRFATEHIFEPLRLREARKSEEELRGLYRRHAMEEAGAAVAKASAYTLVDFRQMVGLVHLIFVQKEHASRLSEMRVVQRPTGVLNVLANKGGVATRFRFYDSTFCFVNAHFNAHKANLARRAQDFRELSSICFEDLPESMGICDHDFAIWLGDLNYRVEMSTAKAHRLIERGEWSRLLGVDQLRMQIAIGQAFRDWQEAPIDFAPTYKYTCNAQTYAREGGRTPSWCDRVLWHSRKQVNCEYYRRHELLNSDHRPVSCALTVPVAIGDEEKRRAVLNRLLRQLDCAENEYQPEATLSGTECNFGPVRFRVASECALELTNTGRVLCNWSFVPKLNDVSICRSWCRVRPRGGLLMPSETVRIICTVCIDETCAAPFNMTGEPIYDILILHLDKSRDHFITLRGDYLPSAFGCSLAYLIRLRGPARTPAPRPEVASPEAAAAAPQGSQLSDLLLDAGQATSRELLASDPPPLVPKELWALVDWLGRHAVRAENLFLESGNTEEMSTIRELVDCHLTIPPDVGVHSVAETLLCFLSSLGEPVVRPDAYPPLSDAPTLAQVQHLFNNLSRVHSATLFYLVCLLRHLRLAEVLDLREVAFLFAGVLSGLTRATKPQIRFWTFVLQLPGNDASDL